MWLVSKPDGHGDSVDLTIGWSGLLVSAGGDRRRRIPAREGSKDLNVIFAF